MRRLLAAATAVLATGTLLGLPASSASANAIHTVNIAGTMNITDDENWPQSDQHRTVTFNRTVTVGTLISQDTVTFTGCAGGEVRVELQLIVAHTNDAQNSVLVTPRVRMFEGTSCSNNDLDGQRDPSAFRVFLNDTATRNYSIANDREGGDRANLSVSVTNL